MLEPEPNTDRGLSLQEQRAALVKKLNARLEELNREYDALEDNIDMMNRHRKSIYLSRIAVDSLRQAVWEVDESDNDDD